MSTRWTTLALAVPLAAALACGGGEQAQQQAEEEAQPAGQQQAAAMHAGHSVTLVPKNESGVNGTAMLRESGDSLRVDVRLAGLTSGESYPVHIHQGTCQEGGGVAAGLNDVAAADSTGSSTTSVAKSALDADRRHFVQAHLPDGTPAACGDVPSEAPAPGSGSSGGESM